MTRSQFSIPTNRTKGYQTLHRAVLLLHAHTHASPTKPDLNSLALGLATASTAGGRPGEVSNRHDEEAVAVVSQTGQGVIPRGKGSHETEETTSHEDGLVGLAGGLVALDVADTQQQESQVQEEEQQEEGNGRSQSAEEQDGREDEPAHQVQTERVVPHRLAFRGQSLHDFEPTGGEHDRERQPEPSVRRQSSSTESVTNSHFPIVVISANSHIHTTPRIQEG